MFPHLSISKNHSKQYTSLAPDSKKEKKTKKLNYQKKKHTKKPNIISTMELFMLAIRLFMQPTLNSRYLILLHT
jgi:hypothetical protein